MLHQTIQIYLKIRILSIRIFRFCISIYGIIRIKSVFYSLCFGEDAPSARAASRFVECFYTWETRTRTVEVENDDGTVTSMEES